MSLSMNALMEKYNSQITKMEKVIKDKSGKANFMLTRDKKQAIATLLENFNVRVKQAQQGLNPEIGKVQNLMEGTGLSSVGPYTKFGINLITAVMSNVVADQLVSIQPMTNRIGEVRYLKYVYESNKGKTTAGDLVSSAYKFEGGNFDYSSDMVTGEAVGASGETTYSHTLPWKPVKPKTVSVKVGILEFRDNGEGVITGAGLTSGTINYSTGALALTFASATADEVTVDYEYITTELNPSVPEIKTEIAIQAITAKSRKLKTAYAFDAAFDLQGDYAFNIDEETTAYFSAEIAHEIDGEIMADLMTLAKAQATKITDFNQIAPTGVSQADHDDSFFNSIIEGGNLIFKRLRRGRASFIVAGVNVCNTIESMRKFVSAGFDATGPHIVGTLNGIVVIKNPFYNDDEYMLGYKGATTFDTGYVYAPYMPVTVIDTIRESNFDFGKGFVTAYGKVAINGACYVYGKVTRV